MNMWCGGCDITERYHGLMMGSGLMCITMSGRVKGLSVRKYVKVCMSVFEGLEVLGQVVICRKERGRRSEVRRGAKYISSILPGSCPDVDLIFGFGSMKRQYAPTFGSRSWE